MTDTTEKLKDLAALLREGLLTREEFDQQKAALLATSGPAHPIPTEVGAYRVTGLIGQGGMGAVYRGRHRSDTIAERQGGDVAIKVMHGQFALDGRFQARFEREASLGLKLDHPGIVKVHDLVVDAGTLALVMEHVEGRSLAHVIGQEVGPIPWPRAWPMFEQLLDVVEYAHGQGVIHRDLKPDNVMVTAGGSLKVLDFGIAKVVGGTGATATGTGMGTVDYMAPEQHTDAKAVDERADVYALGMTLYEMLAGRLPWGDDLDAVGVLHRKLGGDIPPPTAFYPGIPEQVERALLRATTPDRAERTRSVADLRADLAAVSRSRPPTEADSEPDAPARGDGPQVAPRRAGLGLAVLIPTAVLLVVAVACAGGLALLQLGNRSAEPTRDEDATEAAIAEAVTPSVAERVGRHYQSGYQHQQDGRSREAIAEYEAALALDPDHVPSTYEIGWSWWVLERYARTVAAWERVRTLDPDHEAAASWLPKAEAKLSEQEEDLTGWAVAELHGSWSSSTRTALWKLSPSDAERFAAKLGIDGELYPWRDASGLTASPLICEIVMAGDREQLWLFTSSQAPDNDCHGCGVLLSAAVFSRGPDQEWSEDWRERPFSGSGSYGSYTGEASLVSLGGDRYGLQELESWMGQGHFGITGVIQTRLNDSLTVVFQRQLAADNSGACHPHGPECEAWEHQLHIGEPPDGSDWREIVVEDEHARTVARYAFGDGKYTEVPGR